MERGSLVALRGGIPPAATTRASGGDIMSGIIFILFCQPTNPMLSLGNVKHETRVSGSGDMPRGKTGRNQDAMRPKSHAWVMSCLVCVLAGECYGEGKKRQERKEKGTGGNQYSVLRIASTHKALGRGLDWAGPWMDLNWAEQACSMQLWSWPWGGLFSPRSIVDRCM